MHQLIGSTVIVFSLLLMAETLREKRLVREEVSRKIPHIAAGFGVASWPFFVSYEIIIAVAVLFFLAAALVKRFGFFDNLRSVSRLSWGEFFFPIGVIIVAFMEPSKWIFAAAMLHLGLADAAAALVGTSLGKKHRYKVLGHQKSLEGSLAFFTVSVLITAWVIFIAPSGLGDVSWVFLIALPLLATMLENIGVFGLDNLLVPSAVALIMTSMRLF